MQGTNGEWGSKHRTTQQQNEQIGRNSQKFVRISYKFHNASIFAHMHSREIRTKFVRISYEFHVKFVPFANKPSKHTSKNTLQSHGHVIGHAPAFQHLSDRHAGAVLTRCHGVVGRTGGATADMTKCISDSASTLSPLHTSIWCTPPTKKSMHSRGVTTTGPDATHPPTICQNWGGGPARGRGGGGCSSRGSGGGVPAGGGGGSGRGSLGCAPRGEGGGVVRVKVTELVEPVGVF